ncbi:hypothetical protein BE21_57395 [Sorangium cellulosum]|uniref:PGRS family protein n=1 Tax=Sorangium cellulosum TaxID=56 RepID=A0A150U3P1_SORCE|nr:hypothetical protein BE21_57395 [Sorangium cellulosum]
MATAIMATGCDALWLDVTGDCTRMLTCDYFVQAGSGGGTPPSCVPSENAEAVGDACGVFVSASGSDDGTGTKADPVKTLRVAMARAAAEQGSAVYACAEEFTEAAEVPAGMSIFGGLDCAKGWRWIGETAKTVVAPGEEAIALKVMQGEGTVRIEDVSVYAANARTPGASSIAVLVDGAEAELVRCELVAGNGAAGAEGEDAPSEMPAQASPGNAGANACSDLNGDQVPDLAIPGGAQVVNACGGDPSIGGRGGDGNVTNGGGGDIGQVGIEGQSGAGEPATTGSNWSCGVTPGDASKGGGNAGANGSSGEFGKAARGTGTLSSSGYAGVSGEAGKVGKPGQGGGGGGGAKGGVTICPGAVQGAGASGGSGGAGGCGGLPGQGGGAGGASIALASVGEARAATCSRAGSVASAASEARGWAAPKLRALAVREAREATAAPEEEVSAGRRWRSRTGGRR